MYFVLVKVLESNKHVILARLFAIHLQLEKGVTSKSGFEEKREREREREKQGLEDFKGKA